MHYIFLLFYFLLINDALSTTGFFSVDEVVDNEMVFGEMRLRIHYRLPDIRLTVAGNLGKNPNMYLSSTGNRTYAPAQLRISRQTRYFLNYTGGYFSF